MRIDCFFTHQTCKESDFNGRTTVVIDVLRATSSMITALDNGAKAIIPVADIPEALALAVKNPTAILSGEREGLQLEGFDLGNSPAEFKCETVVERLIISCTTNGTAAILKAGTAERVWLGALLNARAVADKLLQNEVSKVAILCAGTMGEPSLDDIFAAGAILSHLNSSVSLKLNDSATIALRLYQSCASMGMLQALKLATHAQKLIRFNRDADVAYCAQENISDTVPWLNKTDGRIYNFIPDPDIFA